MTFYELENLIIDLDLMHLHKVHLLFLEAANFKYIKYVKHFL